MICDVCGKKEATVHLTEIVNDKMTKLHLCEECATEKVDTEGYLTLEQIKELMQDPLVTIGGHSHEHAKFGYFDKLTEKIKHISNDTSQMLDWFIINLGVKPTTFCFPYNDNLDGIYRGMLKNMGFTRFYGKERIPVEHLLDGHTLS